MNNARAIYQLRVKLESCIPLAHNLNERGVKDGVFAAYLGIDSLAFQEARRYSPEIAEWALAAGVAPHILMVLIDAIENCPSLNQLYAVMGLSNTRVFSQKDAAGLVAKVWDQVSRMPPGSGEGRFAAVIAKRTGWDMDRFYGCATTEAVTEILARNPADCFLKSVAIHLGGELKTSNEYSPAFGKFLNDHREANEDGKYAKKARSMASSAGREDLATYELGRLPDSHIEQLAKRDTARLFLLDLRERILSRSRRDWPVRKLGETQNA
jgi:hypothetical protein